MAEYIIIALLVILAGFFAYMYFNNKSGKSLTGKAEIPSHLAESNVMEKWGEAEAKNDENKKKLKEINKQKEVSVNADDQVREREIKEKEKILENSIPLKLPKQKEDKPFEIIGYDKSDFGKLIYLLTDEAGERSWLYYRKGEDTMNLVGGKPLNDMVDKIDIENRRIFIRFDKDENHIKKEFEQF